MANTIKVKRSAVQGKVPQTSDLQLGELAINTYDGKLFLKKNNGTESIVDISSGGDWNSITNKPTFAASATTDTTNASNITSGKLPIARGGTNISSYTKGDLLVASGTTTLSKLGAGLDGYVLTADSSQPTGLRWAEGSTGGGGGGTGTPGSSSDQIILECAITISVDYSISSGNNALSIDTVVIDDGVTVEVPTGSIWKII